ncbi:diguanylate cyclase domain-containing protein [Microbacterium sp. NPDC056234]|uniref:diguanylate cyclase domain-containing protein n=1 Tax=Microbacterium sp. NPDC056234 TaxID=3345757 RepID=UPI0035D74FF0
MSEAPGMLPAAPDDLDLLARSPAALFALDLNGTVLSHNETLGEWFGRAGRQSLRGRNIVEWLTPSARLLYETKVMPRLLEVGRLREIVLDVVDTRQRQRVVLLNAVVGDEPSGRRRVYVAAVEASARSNFERELVEARRAADLAHRRLSVLQEATSALAIAGGLGDLGRTLTAAATTATTAGWSLVRLVDTSASTGVVIREWGRAPEGVLPGERLLPDGGQRVHRDPDQIADLPPEEAAALRSAGVESLVATPIVRGAEGSASVLGEIWCWFRRPRTLDADELETLRSIAAQAERVVEHLRLQEKTRHHALHDPLTTLPNRLLFEERLDALLAAPLASGRVCAVLFLDLDGFKQINDRWGHAAGDEVLRVIAARLAAAIRVGDTVARLGGDEFLVAVGDMEPDRVLDLADRLRKAISAPRDGEAGAEPLSASVGVFAWRPDETGSPPSAAELMAGADEAMYAAKRAGKDRAIVRFWESR